MRNEAYYHADPANPDDVSVPGDDGGIYTEEGAAIQMRNATAIKPTLAAGRAA